MESAKEISLAATVENLPLVNEFVETLLAEEMVSAKAQMQIELSVEEVFVNIANYAYGEAGGKATVQGKILNEPAGLELVFIDGGQPYDPLSREEPDLEQKMEDRAIGGLGIYLVKKNMDEVHYAYQQGKNILTLRKYF
ncbi:ATP-binding protein [Selenomonas ruminantium]|uniref:Anti-sigma regulatory factor (Ser/Thr protein kinase) n=1 Tax=Selenomonas ruminantium TaxID=971 RepID=A0A1H0QAM6_SELRU|nr:ATP-binding protein [Selenomonas ruminantium]SDP14240.1 Anti-sigma regulatory factor (Ser/Thr protein kinase) [Selenomonas ruminantium]